MTENQIKARGVINKLNLTHWYQPIYNLKSMHPIGYEALLRCENYSISPIDIFNIAHKEGCKNRLDYKLLLDLIETTQDTKQNNKHISFFNVFPTTLLAPTFMHNLEKININYPLILEISEIEPIKDWDKLKDILRIIRSKGIGIALDDMGTGYSFFQQWVEFNPDYIKLDRYYSSNLARNPLKQKVVKSLTKLFKGHTKVILEGIETEEDLSFAQEIGIEYAQGYLLGKPSPIKNDICYKNKLDKLIIKDNPDQYLIQL